MTRLSAAALPELDARVTTPGYDRDAVSVGIVHIGVGGFHRAHEAQYVERILHLPGHSSWGIAGVGLLAPDRRMAQTLEAQDHLYTLVTRTPEGSSSASVIGSIGTYLLADEDSTDAIVLMASPSTRIVSLTITEGGYPVSPAGEFVIDETVQADIDRAGTNPRTAFGLIVAALQVRKQEGLAPFTVMSCDNIQGNGDIAHAAVVGFARAQDPELADWIAAEGAFPNSMVDRITPATTDEGRAFVAETFGIDDEWPVISESFTQWVLEDHFVDGRPPFDEVGVQLVADVKPYEAMKLRLLNASHQAVGHLGLLSGYRFVHEAVRDPAIADFLLGYMTYEASPTLAPLPGIDLADYRLSLLERFANPAIADTLARLVADATDRIGTFLVPVIADRLRANESVDHCALVLAAWAQFVRTTLAAGGAGAVPDSRRDEVIAAVRTESQGGTDLLDLSIFHGLGEDPRLIDAYQRARQQLTTLGPGVAMRALKTAHNPEFRNT